MDEKETQEQRTLQQNKALHLFFTMLADTLNDSGLYMNKLLRVDIDWTPTTVKKYLWRPFQFSLFETEHTRDLTKREQIEKVHKVLMRELGEKKGVPFVPFPSEEELSLQHIDESKL